MTTKIPGTLLVSTTTGQPGERCHLCRLDDGSYAVVESWRSVGDWGTPVRRFAIAARIRPCTSIDGAIERFRAWAD